MRKMTKRALSFLLCIVLCVTMLPGGARAAEEDMQPAEAASEELSAQVTEEVTEETAELPAEAAAHAPEGEPVRSAGDVEINETNFPDETFRAYVSRYCDKDQNGYLSEGEIAAVTEISYSGGDIASLKGVEIFSALEKLSCVDNQLTELDVSQNAALTELLCTNCHQLTALNVSGCTALTDLEVFANALTALDVSGLTALTFLDCYGNQLSTLDANGCTALVELCCYGNQLTTLDVNGCTALEILTCGQNQLTELDVSSCTAIKLLSCRYNRLTALDVSGCTVLPKLWCEDNQLTSLDVSDCTMLESLSCDGNQLTMLNISQCPNLVDAYLNGEKTDSGTYESYRTDYSNLSVDKSVVVITDLADFGIAVNEVNFPDENFRAYVSQKCDTDSDGYLSAAEIAAVTEIYCSNKKIASLQGIEFFAALETLVCANNKLTELDVSSNTALKTLDCGGNQLTSLDVNANTALAALWCDGNQLTSLDVSANTELVSLSCSENQLTSLDVSANTALKSLKCSYNNQMTLLSVSDCAALTSIECNFNDQMTALDLEGCTALTSLTCCCNSKLTVLNVSGCTALKTLSCGSNKLTALDVSNNTALTDLDCSGNQLTSLDVSANTALTTLNCGWNKLTALDMSSNPELWKLYCDENQLTTLDISNCSKLSALYCNNNQLTALDVSGCTRLRSLGCGYNQLTALDVSGIPYLESLGCPGNQLSELHINRALQSLSCERNQLTTLDLSHHGSMRSLICYGNRMASLDISQCLKLVDAVQNGTRSEKTASDIEYVDYELGKNGQTYRLQVDSNTCLSEDGGLPHIQLYGCSLSLEGDIGVNFYLVLPEEIANDPDASVYMSTLNYSSFSKKIADARRVKAGDLTLYVFKCPVPAKHMGNRATLRVFNGEDQRLPLESYSTGENRTVDGFQMSVQDYIAKIRADSNSSAKLLALVEAMSDYGSAAQKQFNYNAGTAAAYYHGDAISAVTPEDLDPYRIEKIETERKGIELVGMTLTLEAETVTNLYFKVNEGAIGDYRFYVDGKLVSTRSTSSGYVVKIPQIAAKNLDKYYKVEVYDAQGVCLTLKVPALYYAYQVLNLEGQSDTLVELVKALYLYNQAANVYFK